MWYIGGTYQRVTHQLFRYFMAVVKCSNHQANLALGSPVSGPWALVGAFDCARISGRSYKAVCGAVVRLFKYLVGDYEQEFLCNLQEVIAQRLDIRSGPGAEAHAKNLASHAFAWVSAPRARLTVGALRSSIGCRLPRARMWYIGGTYTTHTASDWQKLDSSSQGCRRRVSQASSSLAGVSAASRSHRSRRLALACSLAGVSPPCARRGHLRSVAGSRRLALAWSPCARRGHLRSLARRGHLRSLAGVTFPRSQGSPSLAGQNGLLPHGGCLTAGASQRVHGGDTSALAWVSAPGARRGYSAVRSHSYDVSASVATALVPYHSGARAPARSFLPGSPAMYPRDSQSMYPRDSQSSRNVAVGRLLAKHFPNREAKAEHFPSVHCFTS